MQFTNSDSEDEEKVINFKEISNTKMGETSVKYSQDPNTILGNGLTSYVYPGYHFGINKPAAVKFIKKQYLRVENDQVNELKIWSEIDQNINIIRLYDSYRDPSGGMFLAMEKAERTFREQVEKHNPRKDDVIKWLYQVSKAVEYLHSRGVIHRDIKPDNILMVSQDGKLVAKLADFGVSKMISSAERSGTFSVATGTLLWMAPEALENKSKMFKNTKMLDIYGLGLTFYFGLSKGGHPDVISKILSEDQVAAHHLISGMLEKEPSSRPKIAQILDHCLFWEWERAHIFLIRVAICLSDPDSSEVDKIKNYIDREYKQYFWLVNGGENFNWISVGKLFDLNIPKLLFTSRKRKRPSGEYGDGGSVTKFLKLFRDKYVHHPDMNEHAALEFSDEDESFCEEKYVKILTIVCPNLLAVLYRILYRVKNVKCLRALRKLYFPWKHGGTNTQGSEIAGQTMYELQADFKEMFAEYLEPKRIRQGEDYEDDLIKL